MTQQLPEIISSQSSQISILTFTINIFLSGFLSSILGWTYRKFGRSLSNRDLFSENFFIISMTTMLIISVVKSSLALSLGLVGALSIIRFRTAIKEPEELAYLFLAIAIGLGLGADQLLITIIALLFIVLSIIIFNKIIHKPIQNKNMMMVIQSNQNTSNLVSKISEIIGDNCESVNLRRLDSTDSSLEVSYIIKLNELSSLVNIEDSLRGIDENISISFMDNKGLFN